MFFCPSARSEQVDLLIGHVRQAPEHIFQVGVRVDPIRFTALQDRVNNRAAPTRFFVADEQPVFFLCGAPHNRNYAEPVIMLSHGYKKHFRSAQVEAQSKGRFCTQEGAIFCGQQFVAFSGGVISPEKTFSLGRICGGL